MTQMKNYTQYIHKDNEWRVLGGSQSGNPDWQQNDNTKSDYIKNRTHYIENSEICIEETFNSCSFSNQGNYYKAELALNYFMPEEGDIVTITVNNHTFTDKLQRIIPVTGPEDYQWGGDGIYEMGDHALVDDYGIYDNIQKPYYLYFNNYYGSTYWELDLGRDILSSSGSYKVEFSLVRNSYKALEPEYSPYNVKENNIVLNDSRNIVESHHALAEGIGTAATGVGAHAEGFGYSTFPEEETIHSLDHIEIIRGDSINNTIVIYDSSENFYNLKKGYLLYAEEVFLGPAKGGGTKAAAAGSDFLGEIEKIENYYDDEYQPALICYLKNVPEDIDLSNYEPSELTFYKLEVHSCKYTSATWAAGGASHAEGINTQALEDAAHAEGHQTYAYGFASHAEGYSTGASGQGSHTEGSYTSTSGSASHAEGSHTEATGNTSHAEGYYTEAKGSYQHVQGKYNIIDNNNTYADIIGNGSSDNSRSNAATVDWNGNAWYAGKVTVGSGPVNDMDLATKKYIDDNFMSGMTILSYGSSTWDDFIAAYTAQRVIYCRASSNSNPASGSQTRLAFMAYVNNAQSPTEAEFQYYRSVSSHSETQQGDQVYVYKLNKTNGWSVTTRECYTKVVGGTDITGTWSNGTLTLDHDNSGVTAGTYKSVTVDATGHVTAGTNPTTLSGYGITDAKIASGVITLGSNTITPLTSSSTLDATKLSGTIPSGCYIDTKNTAGSTNSSSTLYLIGATSQATNPQTYSNSRLYYSSGLHSGVSTVGGSVNSTFSQTSNTTTISEDDSYDRGEFKVEVNSVKLSAKNYDNNKTSTVEVKSGTGVTISSGVGVTINNLVAPTNNTDAANKQYVDNAVASVTPTIPNATSTTVGGIKMRLDANTNTLYITNDGSNA